MKQRINHYIVALGIITLITIGVSYPLLLKIGEISSNGGEEYLVAYLISWVSYSVPNNIVKLFDVPFMHPTSNALAFSDYFISQGILGIPLQLLITNPLALYNLLVLLALLLNPLSFYLLAYQLTKNPYAALAGAIIFGFSVGRIDTLGHLQVFAMYWLLFGLWALVKYVETNNFRFAVLLALMFIASGTGYRVYDVYVCHFGYVCFGDGTSF
jgi:hypothetical protein